MKQFNNYCKSKPSLTINSWLLAIPFVIIWIITMLIVHYFSPAIIILMPFLVIPFYFMSKRFIEGNLVKQQAPMLKRHVFMVGLTPQVRAAFAPFINLLLTIPLAIGIVFIATFINVFIAQAVTPDFTVTLENFLILAQETIPNNLNSVQIYLSENIKTLWPLLISEALFYFIPMIYMLCSLVYRTFHFNYQTNPAIFSKQQIKSNLNELYYPNYRRLHIKYFSATIALPIILSTITYGVSIGLFLTFNPSLQSELRLVYLISSIIAFLVFAAFLPILFKYNYCLYEQFLDNHYLTIVNVLKENVNQVRSNPQVHPANIAIAEHYISTLERRGDIDGEPTEEEIQELFNQLHGLYEDENNNHLNDENEEE